MTKPTTEIRLQDLKYGPNLTAGELADHLDFDAQIGRAHRAANNGWGSGHEDTWEKAAAKLRELERENAEFRARMEDLRVIGVFMAGDTPPFISAVFGQISGHYFDAIEAELKNQDVKVEGDALVYVEYKVESDREDFWLKELSRQVEDAPIKTPEDS